MDDLAYEDFPEIVDLVTFLQEEERSSTGFVTKGRIHKNLEKWGNMINHWVVYPDIFTDMMSPRDSEFTLYPFQRIMMRAMARYKQSYLVFSRGTSKSFLAFLDRYIHAMLIPRHRTGVIAGTKKQAASIAKEKIIDDLWNKFKFLGNEMKKRRVAGKLLDAYSSGQDYARFNFKSGSWLDVASDRGLRRESAIFEEVIEQDPTFIREIALPWLNKPRATAKGKINPNEPQSQTIFVTTAGFQGTFAYEKLIETLAFSVLFPNKYIVLTGDVRIPLYHNLITQDTVDGVKNSPSYSLASFNREYMSVWSDSPIGQAFKSTTIPSLRKVKRLELKNQIKEKGEEFYAIAVDMAKDGDAATAGYVARVIPKEYFFRYKIVNVFKIESTDYMQVANKLKILIREYNPRIFIYDANGVGAGLRDWINRETINDDGMPLSGYGIINPPSSAEKDVIRYPDSKTIVYEIKSGGASKSSEIHDLFFARISNGSITFPIKWNEAAELYSKNENFIKLPLAKKEEILRPYKLMDLAELQFNNLDVASSSEASSRVTKIARRSNRIQKDYFSAAEYLIYGVNQEIESKYYKKRSNGNSLMSAFIFE